MEEIRYPVALRGLGTEFPESDKPVEFASKLTNRFINIYGHAEKRPGCKRIESPYTNTFDGAATYTSQPGRIDHLFEHVSANGTEKLTTILYTTTASSHSLRSFDENRQAWNTGSLFNGINDPFSNLLRCNQTSVSGRFTSTQVDDRTIIASPNYWTMEYKASNFDILLPVIEQGRLTANTSANKVYDSAVGSWLNSTFVSPFDLLYNVSKSAYGIITSVGTTDLDVTTIGSAGENATGIGLNSSNVSGFNTESQSGDYYKVIDLVENNIFEFQPNIKENNAIATSATDTSVIAVSGVDFSTTKLLRGDYVYNSTRNKVTRVLSVSANCRVNEITGQVPGDSLVFLRRPIPPSNFAHNHYGRLYLIDERDKNKIRVGGINDPNDFTTFTNTLESATLDLGSNQPQGESLLSMASFQRYLVIGGTKNTYIYQGTNPIVDVSGNNSDVTPVGLFNNPVLSQNAFANMGQSMAFMSNDGARSFNISDVLAVQTDNISEAIKTEFREAIQSNNYAYENLQVVHYAKRNWVMFKVGTVIYNFNYTPLYVNGQFYRGGSWSKFTGLLAEGDHYLVRKDGTLVFASYDADNNANYIYEFDTGDYQDDLVDVPTEYESAWITLEADSGRGIVKDGRYIKPYLECYGDTNYYINAVADLETNTTCDSVVVSALGGGAIASAAVGTSKVGGNVVINELKHPLRWRGEQMKLSIATSGGNGKETISKFVLYGNTFGRK